MTSHKCYHPYFMSTIFAEGIVIRNGSLILERAVRRNEGKYHCSAVNIEGKSMSNILLLEIHCKDRWDDDHSTLSILLFNPPLKGPLVSRLILVSLTEFPFHPKNGLPLRFRSYWS